MITFKSSCDFLSGVVLLVFSATTSLALDYQLSPTKIQPGERATLEVRLPIAPGKEDQEIDPPQIQDDLLTNFRGLLILERDYRREKKDWVWHYEVTAYQLGKIVLPPVEIKDGAANYSTESIGLEIATTRAQDDSALRPEYGTLSPPIRWRQLLGGAFALALLALALYYGEKYLRKYWPRKPLRLAIPAEADVPHESDLDWLKRELNRIRVQLEVPSPRVELLDDLTYVLREYFQRATKRPVKAWTTGEFQRELGTAEAAGKITPLFRKCDHFKFTGELERTRAKEIALHTLEESEKVLLACGT